nr:hypothetical protein [Nitrosomonas nitrosa]
MLFDLLKSFGPALVSVLFAAAIARHWQHRNWLQQQRVLDAEKSYQEQKALFDDFVKVASRRLTRSRRLFGALQGGSDERIEACLKEYETALLEWNDSYHTLFARFVRVMKNGYSLHLLMERDVRVPLVDAGALLERAERKHRNGHAIALSVGEMAHVRSLLGIASRNIIVTSRSIYKDLQAQNAKRLDDDLRVQDMLRRGEYQDLDIFQIVREIRRPARKPAAY